MMTHLDNTAADIPPTPGGWGGYVPMAGLGIGQRLAWLKRETPRVYQTALPLIV